MPHSLLMDNWTLQNAGELICDGLDGDTGHDLVFSSDGKNFHYDEISLDIIRFESLCQLLSNIVFAESLFVDAEFADRWMTYPPMLALQKQHILFTKPFKEVEGQWIPYREHIADELCINPSLLKKHRANKRSYSKTGKSNDPFLAQLLWGGAGMLARASHFGLPYVPHPSRERLLRRARFLAGANSAEAQVKDFVSAQRVKISKRIDDSGFLAHINLPAVAVLVLENSDSLQSLLPTAFQIRSEFRQLRNWLGKFQTALDLEDVKAVLAEQKKLESVVRHVDSCISLTPAGETSVQFGVALLKIGAKIGSPINTLQNCFGVRAELNRLILAPPGRKALKKFLRMLGEERTRRGLAFQKEVLRRSVVNGSERQI